MNVTLFAPIVLAAALFAPSARQPRAPAAPSVIIRVESLGLELASPEGWRLSRESTPQELIFYPGRKKTSPLLRVRAFKGNLSPRDRLAEMTRGLPEEEAGVHFVSEEKWTRDRHRFETVSAVHKQGAREWHASFTLADQPGRVQHGFWLFGFEKDLLRHREVIQATIASARRVSGGGSGTQRTPEEEPTKEESQQAVWSDAGSGLHIASWPAGFALDPKTSKQLAKDGLRLAPSDDRAHAKTCFLLTSRPASKGQTASDLAATLHTELGTRVGVEGLRRIPVRIGGLETALLSWTEEDREGATFTHQVYLVQHDETVVRIAFEAEESWAGTRSRRGLVKDFVAGIRFE